MTKSATSPPSPPAAPAEAKASGAAPDDRTTQRDPDEAAADVRLTVAPEPVPDSASAAGIGIARFASVNLKLAGGGLPSAAGLTWLVEKGYRTLVDLRESPEVSPSFITSVANRGLRYVALPINLKTIDTKDVARFNFEVGADDARPLFFFDSDGSRPGALWYIRRLTVDQVDPQLARREAEELGLLDKTAWLATTQYVEKRNADLAHPESARSGATNTSSQTESKDHAASADRDRGDEIPAIMAATADNAPTPTAGQSRSTDANRRTSDPIGDEGKPVDKTDSLPMRDTLVWRPLAAVLLTGLSVPLVYWTRTAVPAVISRARASLPAPGLRPRSLPLESGD